MRILSSPSTGMLRAAPRTTSSVGGPSRTRGRRRKRAADARLRAGSSSPAALVSRGTLRTAPSASVLTLTCPSADAAWRIGPLGRAKSSNSWARPGLSSPRGPSAIAGVTTLPAVAILRTSSSSSAVGSSKRTSNATTRAPAATRLSRARAYSPRGQAEKRPYGASSRMLAASIPTIAVTGARSSGLAPYRKSAPAT